LRRQTVVAVPPARPRVPRLRAGLLSLTAIALLAMAPGAAPALADDPTAGADGVAVAASEVTLREGDRGRAVRRLQRKLGISADGVFGPQTDRAVKRFQRRNGLTADGIVGPMTRAKFRPRKVRTATWYGPGLYGNELACGGKLTPNTFGVAHKTLPCGKKVTIAHGGRIVIARVIDRGPFVKGVEYDLTEKTARSVRMGSTSEVRASR
jgi:rare lipoprotein A (peptidoglycan hydrolase)